MKRLYRPIAWLLLCAAAALIVLYPAGDADQKREAAIRARYGGFSGVLRLWTCEDLSPLSGWLNGRIAAFEKAACIFSFPRWTKPRSGISPPGASIRQICCSSCPE